MCATRAARDIGLVVTLKATLSCRGGGGGGGENEKESKNSF